MEPSLADRIDALAGKRPDAAAFLCGDAIFTWSDYAERSDRLATTLIEQGVDTGERVAVLLPDGPGVHAAFVGVEKAGCIVVGIGPRAGAREIAHLLEKTGASALVSPAQHRGMDLRALASGLRLHVAVEGELGACEPALSTSIDRDGIGARRAIGARRLGADDLFLLNSTSGTTGLPKVVTHTQARWFYFHDLAVEAGEFVESDIFLSALPAPFGFGIWTAHVTPTLLGAPTVLLPQFSPEALIEALERHRVSVMAAVSTQFIMMLDSPALAGADLGALRALFTGGEAVPYERAAEFEERTGAAVLQFYGSNETGALSRTTTRDTRERRLRTAGRVIEGMAVRLFDDDGRDATAQGVGQPGCRGPATSQGYYGDEEANAALYTEDGWMLTGDVATLDAEGYLKVVGRKADFIIRGGKNISGAVVEEAVASHPEVSVAAAVPMPDPVFGERVCVYAELRGVDTLSLDALVQHLETQGVSKELFPERLVVLPELPRSSGGKIAKQALKDDIVNRLAQERP